MCDVPSKIEKPENVGEIENLNGCGGRHARKKKDREIFPTGKRDARGGEKKTLRG